MNTVNHLFDDQLQEPGDARHGPQNEIGLCMSGGGYRAMVFHLGSPWRLNDAGLLRGIHHFSSVSGGSIANGRSEEILRKRERSDGSDFGILILHKWHHRGGPFEAINRMRLRVDQHLHLGS